MFALNTAITLDDGFARPAGPGDTVWGVVCGPPDLITQKVPVSKLDAPDRVIEFYYHAEMFDTKPAERFEILYGSYNKTPKKRASRIKKTGGPT